MADSAMGVSMTRGAESVDETVGDFKAPP